MARLPAVVLGSFLACACGSSGPKPDAAPQDGAGRGGAGGTMDAPAADADAGADAVTDATGGAPGGGEVVVTSAWPMPNPPSTGLPNPASYDTSVAGLVHDLVTGLDWQRTVDPNSFVWADAAAACDSLVLAGHDDWRLPSFIELVSLVDFTRMYPAIDPDAFPDTPADSTWTSSAVAGDAGEAWYVSFTSGFDYQGHEDFLAARARCVRGPQAGTGGGGTLTWTVAPSGPLSWDNARQYCENLTIDAGGGWRLPSMKELLTIVDVTRSDPAVDPALFPGADGQTLWTSSAVTASPGQYWVVEFSLGDATPQDAASPIAARCVR